MRSKTSLSKTLRKENLSNLLFVTPQLLLFAIFILLPFIVSIPLAFTDYVDFTDTKIEFAGFKNFVRIFTNPTLAKWIWPSVRQTFFFMIGNYLTVFLFGMTFALMMYELTTRIQKSFFLIIYLPYIISGLGVGMFIDLLFARDSGSLNLLLKLLNLIETPINLKTHNGSLFSLIFFVGWRYAGYNMAIFLSGLLTIPNSTIDSSKIDGANYLQRLWHIYIPQMIPSIAIASISCIIGSFGIFDEPVGFGALYGNEHARLYAVSLFRMGVGVRGAGTLAEGVASSIVVFTPLLVIALLIFRWQRRKQII